jgi:hypothetical protein
MQGREEGGNSRAAALRSLQKQENKDSNLNRFVCTDVERDVETTRKIYESLIQAKQKCDKSIDDLSFPSFQKQLAAQIARFKQNNDCRQIQFDVGVDNNQVVFKARPVKDE